MSYVCKLSQWGAQLPRVLIGGVGAVNGRRGVFGGRRADNSAAPPIAGSTAKAIA